MRLYNSMSRQLEDFVVDDNRVGVYVCGVTPYDTTHIGHVFTFLTFDVLVRYLRFRGYDVTYVQNVTDIDDDILRKSAEVGMDWQELGKRETDQLLEDLHHLNAVPFDHFTAATDHINEVIELVKVLVEKGFAYEANGSVYFHVSMVDDFGKLSHLDPNEMLPIANERGNNPNDPNKQNPMDFVLWQAAKPGEPTWDTPWGPGRPGWHVECTAMAQKYLGEQFAIHGGGYDLIFPHHECEIAQAENATGKEPYVRYWMHAAMVDYQGEKMSKSLGNLVYVRDLLRDYSGDAIRMSLLAHRYRERWGFFDAEMPLHAANAAALAAAAKEPAGNGDVLNVDSYRERFMAAMDNDLDTPTAVMVLDELGGHIMDSAGMDVRLAQDTLRELAGLLGLVLQA
jgi:L-cysteine:1D-myo-inositol 2-amino-2-deoxy-alpha-D-glucopyranoside ligase